MAVEDVVRFMVRAGQDPELNAQLKGASFARIAGLAQERGFAFSQFELEHVLHAQVGELSDAELEGASGGVYAAAASGAASGAPAGTTDPNALVQWVLHESYLDSSADLRSYAEKVKYFNATKKMIRDHL